MEKEDVLKQDDAVECTLRTLEVSSLSVLRGEHFHKEVELVWVESGRIACTASGQKFTVEQGNIILIERRVPHCLHFLDDPARVTYLQIDIDGICNSMFPDFSLGAFTGATVSKKYGIYPINSQVGRLFLLLREELTQKKAYYAAAVKGCVYQLVALMAREGLIEDGLQFISHRSYQKILPALAYAQRHFSEKISLEELCGFLNTDKFNFCKQFKRVTNATFFQYLTFVRIRHAEELLMLEDISISEIALACGFSSVQYLNRVFCAKRGCSPSAFRNMLGGAEAP